MNKLKLMVLALLISSTGAMFAKNKQQIRLSNQYGEAVLVHLEWKMNKSPHFTRTQDIIIKGRHKNFLIKAPVSGYHLVSLSARPSKATLIAATAAPAALVGGVAVGVATGGTAVPLMATSPILAASTIHTLNTLELQKGSYENQKVRSLRGTLEDSYKVHTHKNSFFVIANRKEYSAIIKNDKSSAINAMLKDISKLKQDKNIKSTKNNTITSIEVEERETPKKIKEYMHIKGYKSQKDYENELEKFNASAIDEPTVEIANNEITEDYQDVTATDAQPNIEETLVLVSQDGLAAQDQLDYEDANSDMITDDQMDVYDDSVDKDTDSGWVSGYFGDYSADLNNNSGLLYNEPAQSFDNSVDTDSGWFSNWFGDDSDDVESNATNL